MSDSSIAYCIYKILPIRIIDL